MQKNFVVGTLQQCHGQDKKEVSNGMIIAYRSGNNYHVQHLDLGNKGEIEVDAMKGEVILRFSINDGECLVLQDKVGIAEKREIKK
jgi:uncharacterized protein YeaC (DUF1315 family)